MIQQTESMGQYYKELLKQQNFNKKRLPFDRTSTSSVERSGQAVSLTRSSTDVILANAGTQADIALVEV